MVRQPNRLPYPYGKKIRQRDAVDLIRSVFYPGEEKKQAGSRILYWIKKLQKNGDLPKGKVFGAAQLFGKLTNANPKWAGLDHRVANLPLEPQPVYFQSRMTDAVYVVSKKMTRFEVPTDCNELRRRYEKVTTRLVILEAENQDLRAEVARWREADARRRQIGRESGIESGKERRRRS